VSAGTDAPTQADRDLRLRGEAATRQGDHIRALEIWQQLLKDRPDDVDVLLRLGVSQSLLARFDEAEKTFRRGMELQPGRAQLPYSMGLMFFRKGDVAQAETFLNRALNLDPKLPGVHEHLALLCEKRGDRAGAERHFLQEINTNSRSLGAWEWALRGDRGRRRREVTGRFAIIFLLSCLAASAAIWLIARRRHQHDADGRPTSFPSPPGRA